MVVRANPEKKEEKERVRQALLRATLGLAAAHGFASLGLREVSREALIAPTSFYRHFEDMEELGVALVEEKVAPLLEDAAVRAEASLRSRATMATALTYAMFEVLEQGPEVLRFVLSERVGGSARVRAALAQKVARFQARVAQLLEGAGLGASPVAARSASVAALAAGAIVAVLLDASFRGLEAEGSGRASVRADAVEQVSLVVAGLEREP